LLLRVRAIAKHEVALFGQDIDPANIELSYLNMFIHGCEDADIRVGDTLNAPKHVDDGQLTTYDYIVSNPKFSLHNWMNGASANDEFGRWNADIGVPPQQYGDFAFLMHCVKCLKSDGKCAIILPNGVLTRGGEEAKLRKWLVEQRLLSGIIAFPANTFFGTSIAGNVLVIDKTRPQDGVFFIDASELGYKDADSKIRLREQDIKRIVDVWRARQDVPHFAHLATFDAEQKENEDVAMYEVERNGFAFREFAVMYLDDIVKMSMHEQLMTRDFIILFMIVALLISILGMIAMSYYFAGERTSSIAIHKIYGGTVRSETIRNVRSFMYITATACLVGLPLGWYMTRSYLSEFTAEIETFVPQLLATAAVIFTTSLLSVLWQTLRAARTNPAEALKKE
jgi:hypothetical protein